MSQYAVSLLMDSLTEEKLTWYKPKNDNPQELFHDSDVALYYVKDHGRNGCCFYEAEMRDKPEGRF